VSLSPGRCIDITGEDELKIFSFSPQSGRWIYIVGVAEE
jgi:hypothetical protein